MLTTIGILAYFMSSFQIIPYLHGEIKDKQIMEKTVNFGAIGSIVMISSVILYFLFSKNDNLDYIRHASFAIIGSCVTIINVLPTREFIIQILQKKGKLKQKTRDMLITLAILTFTMFLSILLVNVNNWKIFIGLGTILTSLLGFIFPAILYFIVAKPEDNTKKIFLLAWNSLLGLIIFVSGIFMILVEPFNGKYESEVSIILF